MALPALIGSWVASAFAVGIGSILARGLLALGIGYTTYTFLMPSFVGMLSSYLGGIPGEVRGVIALCKVDVAMTMILSAISAKMAMRMVWRKV